MMCEACENGSHYVKDAEEGNECYCDCHNAEYFSKNYTFSFGKTQTAGRNRDVFYLPHSCSEWVFGYTFEEARQFSDELVEFLNDMEKILEDNNGDNNGS